MAISPDAQSFVRFGYSMSADNTAHLGVLNFVSGEGYRIPIDVRRMRFNVWEEMDRAWFDHHFEWVQTKGAADRLAARTSFVPLPYRGWRTADSDGY